MSTLSEIFFAQEKTGYFGQVVELLLALMLVINLKKIRFKLF